MKSEAIVVDKVLKIDLAIEYFSTYFKDCIESNIKKVRITTCKKCLSPAVVISGVPEKGRYRGVVEEIICTRLSCGITSEHSQIPIEQLMRNIESSRRSRFRMVTVR